MRRPRRAIANKATRRSFLEEELFSNVGSFAMRLEDEAFKVENGARLFRLRC